MYFDSTPMGLRQMRMDAKIKRIYAEASQDIQAKIDKYNKRYKALDADWQQRVKDGKATKAEYDNWKAGQVFIGKRWESVRDDILHQIHSSNDTSSRIINGEKRAVFIDTVNHAEYSIDKDFDFGLSFNLYDSATLTRILRDDPQILPEVSTDPNRDYAWGRKQITSAITQGIIQGESIPEIGKRIGDKLGSSNQKHMQRLARTAMTSAQNAGRIEAMHNAEEMGIKVQKEWIATLDSKTRDSHQHLDGQVQDVDKPFLSVLGDIMYPGDPDADPANVWCYRCSLGYEYPDYKNQYDQRRARNEEGQNELIDNMTYDQWKDWVNKGKPVKQKEQPEVKEQTIEVKVKETAEPETWVDRINNNIKNHTDDWTTEELQENGRIFINQVNEEFKRLSSGLTIDQEQVEQVRIELGQYNEKMDSIQKKIDKLSEDIKQYEDLLYENLTNKELSEKYEKLLKESSLELDKAKKEQQSIKITITDLSRKEHDLTHPKSTVKIEEVVVKTLSELREVGGITSDNISNYMSEDLNLRNKDKVRENLMNAMNCYPSSWLKTSSKSKRRLCPNYIRDDQRAYYDFSNGEIRISNDKSANVHELGHRFEHVIPGIVESESEFYKKRTDGEPLVWLGAPYKRSEKTRKDHFVHPYMGKDYGDQSSFELVSMGFQFAFTEYDTLAKDEDMQSWIFGLLTSIE